MIFFYTVTVSHKVNVKRENDFWLLHEWLELIMFNISLLQYLIITVNLTSYYMAILYWHQRKTYIHGSAENVHRRSLSNYCMRSRCVHVSDLGPTYMFNSKHITWCYHSCTMPSDTGNNTVIIWFWDPKRKTVRNNPHEKNSFCSNCCVVLFS